MLKLSMCIKKKQNIIIIKLNRIARVGPGDMLWKTGICLGVNHRYFVKSCLSFAFKDLFKVPDCWALYECMLN